jgi:hypothetical protein
MTLIGLGYYFYKFHKGEIESFIKNCLTNWNFNFTNHSRELTILFFSIAIVSFFAYCIKKFWEEQQKIIDESAKEIKDCIFSILEIPNEEGLGYPDIDVEHFSDHYAKEKNISQSLMKKIIKRLDKTFEEKNSEIVKITLYLDGKMKSFWKLKIDCL